MSDRQVDKVIIHGSERELQHTVYFICDILRQTEG